MSGNPPRPWLDYAREDLEVARQVLDENHPAHACFLSQQCIEKSLKAFLIARVQDYPRIHRLVDLLNRCAPLDSRFEEFQDDCARVDEYYVATRYPSGAPGTTAQGMPDAEDAKQAITAAERIFRFVEQQL